MDFGRGLGMTGRDFPKYRVALPPRLRRKMSTSTTRAAGRAEFLSVEADQVLRSRPLRQARLALKRLGVRVQIRSTALGASHLVEQGQRAQAGNTPRADDRHADAIRLELLRLDERLQLARQIPLFLQGAKNVRNAHVAGPAGCERRH